MSPFSSKPMSPSTVLNGPFALMASATSCGSLRAGRLGGLGDRPARRRRSRACRLPARSPRRGTSRPAPCCAGFWRGSGAEGVQRAGDRVAGDRGEFVRDDAVAGHEGRLQALVGQLADDQAGFGVQAAPIDDRDAGFLHLGDEGREVLVADVDAFVHDFGDAGGVHRLLGLVGKALAVGGLVVDDGDLGVLEVGGEVGAGNCRPAGRHGRRCGTCSTGRAR